MHTLNKLLSHQDIVLNDFPKEYLNDSVFLCLFFSVNRNSQELSLVPQQKLKELLPFLLVNNPHFFFDVPKEYQTLENLDIALYSSYQSKTNSYSFLDYFLSLDKDTLTTVFNKYSDYIDLSWSSHIFEQNFEHFKHLDYYIKGYCELLISKNIPISKQIWNSRNLSWWLEHREYYTKNIGFPNYSITNKYFYKIENIPEEFLKDYFFNITLAANCFEITTQLNLELNVENSLKVLATYIYYQEHHKYPDLDFYDDKERYSKYIHSFIYTDEESQININNSQHILHSMEKQQLYISSLLAPFFAELSYEDISEHIYWNHLSFNHIALLMANEKPSFDFIKSFNSTIKIQLLIDKVDKLFEKIHHYQVVFYPEAHKNKLITYILKYSNINGEKLEEKYNLKLKENNRNSTYIQDCYLKYLKPILENDYLDYITPINEDIIYPKTQKF